MSRVTMKSVADVMGVSVMTVSNACNRPDQLSPDLRARILQRAEKMGYGGPSAVARQLRSGRTNAYGVLLSEPLSYAFEDPFSILWLSGLAQALESAEGTMVLLPVRQGNESDLEQLRRASVDGVAAMCSEQPVARLVAQRGLPLVSTDPDDPDGSWVAIDDHAAGVQLGSYLARLGHTDVMVVVGRHQHRDMGLREYTLDNYNATVQRRGGSGFYTQARLRGLVEGLGHVRPTILTAQGNSRESGRRVAGLALDRQNRPSALVCLSDVLALGVLDATSDRGLTPGRDLSVTGFDDLPDASRAGLTTVHQPIIEKGRLVGELLLDPSRQPRRIMLEHRLIVRSSTGPAPHD